MRTRLHASRVPPCGGQHRTGELVPGRLAAVRNVVHAAKPCVSESENGACNVRTERGAPALVVDEAERGVF